MEGAETKVALLYNAAAPANKAKSLWSSAFKVVKSCGNQIHSSKKSESIYLIQGHFKEGIGVTLQT